MLHNPVPLLMRRWTRCGLMFITFLSASRYSSLVFKCSLGDAMDTLAAKYSIIPSVCVCICVSTSTEKMIRRGWQEDSSTSKISSIIIYLNIKEFFFDNIVSLLQSLPPPTGERCQCVPCFCKWQEACLLKKMSPTVLSWGLKLEAFLPQDRQGREKKIHYEW